MLRIPRSKVRTQWLARVARPRSMTVRRAPSRKKLAHFSDLRRGMVYETATEKITKNLLRAHGRIARERWEHVTEPDKSHDGKRRIIVPSGLVISLSHGQESRIQPYALHLASEINYKFLKPVYLGDTIHTRVRITRLEDNPNRNYGYAWVVREIVNQKNEIVYLARAKLLIKKAPG